MKSRFLAGLAVAALCVAFSGCNKKNTTTAKTPPPPENNVRQASAPTQQAPRSTPARPNEVASNTPRMPDAATRARIQDLLNRIQDAYFDYNKHTIRPDAEAALKTDAQTLADILRQYPDFKLTVEGYCDERGSEEYNIALGDARAKQAKEYLSSLGVPANQLRTVSYGKDKPVCTDHDEACWQKNRRAHVTQEQAGSGS
jgi:peptidoglycan-associated lipoprotein